MREAVGRASDLDGLIVLAAEVDLSPRPPRIDRIPYDAESLAGRRVGLAVRIGAFSRGGCAQSSTSSPPRRRPARTRGARRQAVERRWFPEVEECE